MWTTKKELKTAIKLSVEAKGETFPAFVELGPCKRGAEIFRDDPNETPEDALQRTADNLRTMDRWFGKGFMRTACRMYEASFLFKEEWHHQTITLPYSAFKEAVNTLDGREVELVAENNVLYIWQGRECTRLQGLVMGEEMKANLPDINLGPETFTRWLSGYELCGLADILQQVVPLTNKKQGDTLETVYFENRALKDGLEDILVSAHNSTVAAAGCQPVDRLGGLGIFLMPANAARKILSAQRLLFPAGVSVTVGHKALELDFGRFVLKTILPEGQYLSPDATRPGEVLAGFEFTTREMYHFAQKAANGGKRVLFKYDGSELKAFAGTITLGVDARLEHGRHFKFDEREFQFTLLAEDLRAVLKNISAARVQLLFCGAQLPVYLNAAGVRYAVALVPPDKPEGNNDK